MLERDIEQPFVKWCKQVGIKVKKKNFADQLDRWLMVPGGAPIIIEFKAPGKKPTPLQQREIDELKELGYGAGWFDNLEKTKEFVEDWLRDMVSFNPDVRFETAMKCAEIIKRIENQCQKPTNPTPTKRKQ